MTEMTGQIGNREANKRATRIALQKAADRLFASNGYDATTVRDIASVAGVTERTFHRYFRGKEDLLAESTLAWVGILAEAIRRRPASEPPLVAVRSAMLELVRRAESDPDGARPWWLFADRPQRIKPLRELSPHPARRAEESIAAAVINRIPDDDEAETRQDQPDAGFQAELVGRVAVAVLRTAAIRHRHLQRRPGTPSPGVHRLLSDAFRCLSEVTLFSAESPPRLGAGTAERRPQALRTAGGRPRRTPAPHHAREVPGAGAAGTADDEPGDGIVAGTAKGPDRRGPGNGRAEAEFNQVPAAAGRDGPDAEAEIVVPDEKTGTAASERNPRQPDENRCAACGAALPPQPSRGRRRRFCPGGGCREAARLRRERGLPEAAPRVGHRGRAQLPALVDQVVAESAEFSRS